MQDFITIINYPNMRKICVCGHSDGSEMYVCGLWCNSVAFSIAVAITRDGLSSNVLRFWKTIFSNTKKIDNFEVLSFLQSTITIIFVVFCSFGNFFREHRPPPSLSFLSFPSKHTADVASQPPLHLHSSAPYLIAIRFNISTF